MSISFDVGPLRSALAQLPFKVAVATREGVAKGALVYERAIKEEIRGGHPKNTKTGASPGGPPQNVTGNLRRSVTVGPVQGSGLRYTVDIGPSAVYGQYLEAGTSRMPAYPFVQPGAKRADPQAHAVIVAAWREALRL